MNIRIHLLLQQPPLFWFQACHQMLESGCKGFAPIRPHQHVHTYGYKVAVSIWPLINLQFWGCVVLSTLFTVCYSLLQLDRHATTKCTNHGSDLFSEVAQSFESLFVNDNMDLIRSGLSTYFWYMPALLCSVYVTILPENIWAYIQKYIHIWRISYVSCKNSQNFSFKTIH